MQVGSGDGYMVTVEGFNDSSSTLGDSLITGNVNLNINGMKFTTK